MNLKSKLRKHFIKTKTVDTFKLDDISYKVVDRKCFLPSYKDRRDLLFKTEDSKYVYSHSAVFLDTKNVFQPVLITPQKLIDAWSKRGNVDNALVLGCAGCTIPRFIALKYPQCKTVGIEYEEKFIEIAWKYFWIPEFDSKFQLLHGDAFEYVKDTDGEKYDIICVDVFSENQLPQDVFSKEFLSDLNNCSNDNSIIIFNLLEEGMDNVSPFAKALPDYFNEKYIINYDIHCFLVAIKASSDTDKKDFIENLKQIGDITII